MMIFSNLSTRVVIYDGRFPATVPTRAVGGSGEAAGFLVTRSFFSFPTLMPSLDVDMI